MAVSTVKTNSAIVLKYQDGVDENGKDIIKSQKFSKVKVAVSDEAVYNTAKELERLLGKTILELVRTDESSISG